MPTSSDSTCNQCCGAVIIYCGSGSSSYFGTVLVPVPVPVSVPFPDPDLFSTDFNNRKFAHNLVFSMLEAAWFSRNLVSIFYLLL